MEAPIRRAWSRRLALGTVLCALGPLAAPASAQRPTTFEPPWADAVPTKVTQLDHDPTLSNVQNGNRLIAAMKKLVPGERLEIGGGAYTIATTYNVCPVGTPNAPIWIVAKEGQVPHLKRVATTEAVFILGNFAQCEPQYVVVRGLEITGGWNGLVMHQGNNVWIDQCHIHHTGNRGIAMTTGDTEYVWITNNHIHHTVGYGEGIYLGANFSQWVMRYSVIARNLVHHTAGFQGDGIELKQGSYGNWVVENIVHDTQYPCILVYGTDGNEFNFVERNEMWNSGDNVLQVQGEAVVRDNLMMNGLNGFHTHDHQGTSRDLTFVYNTIINEKRGADLQSWGGRPGMTFSNNVVYSRNANSVVFVGGTAGVTIENNAVVGSVLGADAGFWPGKGMGDFEKATWAAGHRDAIPKENSVLFGTGQPGHLSDEDLRGKARPLQPTVGALEPGSWGKHYGEGLPGHGGKTPRVAVSSKPELGDPDFTVELENAFGSSLAVLLIGVQQLEIPTNYAGTVLNDALVMVNVPTNAQGEAALPFMLPLDPTLDGAQITYQWLVSDWSAAEGVSFSDGLATTLSLP